MTPTAGTLSTICTWPGPSAPLILWTATYRHVQLLNLQAGASAAGLPPGAIADRPSNRSLFTYSGARRYTGLSDNRTMIGVKKLQEPREAVPMLSP